MSVTPLIPNLWWPGRSYAGASAYLVDNNANDKMAVRYVFGRNVTVAAADLRLQRNGSTTGLTYNLRWQTEGAGTGLPSGTDVTNGVITSVTLPLTTGWTGPQSFPSGGPALAAGTPYWLVIEMGTGTAWSTTNKGGFLAATDGTASTPGCFQLVGYSHSAAAWGGTGGQALTTGRLGTAVFTLSDSSLYGNPYHNGTTHNVATTTRVGLSFNVAVPTTISGFWVLANPSSLSVSNLVPAVYADADNSLIATAPQVSAASFWGNATLTTAFPVPIDLGSDVLFPPGKYWLSLGLANTADANTWNVAVLQSDYASESVGRAGTSWQVGTRTADSGAWSVPSPWEDAIFGFIPAGQSSGSGGYPRSRVVNAF